MPLQERPTSKKIKTHLSLFDHFRLRRQKNFSISPDSRVLVAYQLISEEPSLLSENSTKNDLLKDKKLTTDALLSLSKTEFQKVFSQVFATHGVNKDQLLSHAKSNAADYMFIFKPGEYRSNPFISPYDCQHHPVPFVHLSLDEPDFIAPKVKDIEVCKWAIQNPIDQLKLKVMVYSVPQERLMEVVSLDIKSGWFSWMSPYSDSESLLKQAFPYLLESYTGVK